MKNLKGLNSKFNLEPITTKHFPKNRIISCEEADNKLVCTLLQKQSADASKHYIFITQKAKYLFTREEEFLNTKLRFPHFSYSVPGLCRRCPTWRASLCKFYITTATISSSPASESIIRESFSELPRGTTSTEFHTHTLTAKELDIFHSTLYPTRGYLSNLHVLSSYRSLHTQPRHRAPTGKKWTFAFYRFRRRSSVCCSLTRREHTNGKKGLCFRPSRPNNTLESARVRTGGR